MSPRKPLAERLSCHTLVPAADIQATLDEPQPGTGSGPCWVWRGALSRGVPTLKHEGRAMPVRRLVHGITARNVRVHSCCPHPLCVNPNHSHAQTFNRILGMEPEDIEPAPIAETVEDVIYSIYHDHPLDDFPTELVTKARAMIERGEA